MNGDAQDGEGVDIGKKQKLGHLRVDTQGNATFKKLPTNQLVQALQLGIQYSVGGLASTPARDVLFQDFSTVEIINFPKSGRSGGKPTPPHRFNDFTIRCYAPAAFRHFREKFNIKPEDYLSSINKPFRELKNPGASGSLFYLTFDDEFIIKTVQKREAHFLKQLLPGYYMNIIQNQRTLLPKFFGLYCYQGDNKNIRIVVMNNLIPSHIHIHEKYDLKGSTYKRRANSQERQKTSPTWKDLDFVERHPTGLILDTDTFDALKRTIERDCRVLESFQIMDYSFLIGVHQVDAAPETPGDLPTTPDPLELQPKRMMYATPMDNIQAEFDEFNKPDDHLAKTGGIPARTASGERLSLYVGIIDILQSYQLRKKLEHTLKSVVTDGTQISVTHPSYYSERFQKFLFNSVFKKAPQRFSRIAANDLHTISNSRTSRPTSANYSQSNHVKSTPSITTNSSHITSYNTSFQSSRQSTARSKDESSHRSDSAYHEPVVRQSDRIITTSFNNNNARMKFYEDLSVTLNKRQHVSDSDRTKYTLSTTNLSYDNTSSKYSSVDSEQTNRSSIEITRF